MVSIQLFEYSNFLLKIFKGEAAAESHVGGNAQPARDRTDQKDLQQNGIKQTRPIHIKYILFFKENV